MQNSIRSHIQSERQKHIYVYMYRHTGLRLIFVRQSRESGYAYFTTFATHFHEFLRYAMCVRNIYNRQKKMILREKNKNV